MRDPAETIFDDVRVVGDNGLALQCVVERRTVWVGRLQVLPGSTVRGVGDRGRLVVPTWLARDLGLVS